MLNASAPPEYAILSLPLNSVVSISATLVERANNDLPDIYISSEGNSFLVTSTGKVFVSFTPNVKPFLSAYSISRFSITTASAHCKSSLK